MANLVASTRGLVAAGRPAAFSAAALPPRLHVALTRSRHEQRCTVIRAGQQALATTIPPTESSSSTPLATPGAVASSTPMVVAALAVGLAAWGLAATDPSLAASSAPTEQFQLAEGGQEFWGNIARYARYFVTVMLGTGYVMLRPIVGAFKNPLSAVFTIAAVAGTVFFVKFTLEAMLGVAPESFDYVQGQF